MSSSRENTDQEYVRALKECQFPDPIYNALKTPGGLALLKAGVYTIQDLEVAIHYRSYDDLNTDEGGRQWMEYIGEKITVLTNANVENIKEVLKNGWLTLSNLYPVDLLRAILSDNGLIVLKAGWYTKYSFPVKYPQLFYSDGAITAIQQDLLSIEKICEIMDEKDLKMYADSSGRRFIKTPTPNLGHQILEILFSPIGITMLQKGYIHPENIVTNTAEFAAMLAVLVSPEGLKACEEGRIINPPWQEAAEVKRESWQQLTVSQALESSIEKLAAFLSPTYETSLQNNNVGITRAQIQLFKNAAVLSEFLAPDNIATAKKTGITPEQAASFKEPKVLRVMLTEGLPLMQKGSITPELAGRFQDVAVLRVMLEPAHLQALKEDVFSPETAEKFKSKLAVLREALSPPGIAALKRGEVKIAELLSFEDNQIAGLRLMLSTRGLIAKHEGLLQVKDFQISDFKIEKESKSISVSEFTKKAHFQILSERLTGSLIQQALSTKSAGFAASEHKAHASFPASYLENTVEIKALRNDEMVANLRSMESVAALFKQTGGAASDRQNIFARKIPTVFEALTDLNTFNQNYFPSIALKPHALIEKKLRTIDSAFITCTNQAYASQGEDAPNAFVHQDILDAFQKVYYQLIKDYFQDTSVNVESIKRLQSIINSENCLLKVDNKFATTLQKESKKSNFDFHALFSQKTQPFLEANKLINDKLVEFEKQTKRLK